MDIAAWNECLFEALVRESGAPGDPLYLYVDDDVLAQASGARSPDEALDDFKQAFRATSFAEAHRAANAWKQGGYPTQPPHVAALAMTVLAVTLSPLGRAEHNVYSRQRDLLGLENLDEGAPEGYREHVPSLWRLWNEWLDTSGAEFGVSTARAHEHFRFQGWARSQSFIHAREKQDIYAFLEARGQLLGDDPSAAYMISQLSTWLRAQGSSSRLLRVAGDVDYHDELGQCLVAARRYWRGELQARAVRARLRAVPHWSPESRKLSLVVKVRDQRGATGVEVVDLALQRWTVGLQDLFMYLTPEAMPADDWIDEPIVGWRFGPVWIVDWEPPDGGLILFEETYRGHWLMTERPCPEGTYRLLAFRPSVHIPRDFDTMEGPEGACRWLAWSGSQLIPGSKVLQITGGERATSGGLKVRLGGGLKIDSDATYLVGGDPDVEIRGIDQPESALIKFDGEVVDASLLSLHGDSWRLRLRSLYPGPGAHRLTILTDHTSRSLGFVTKDSELVLGTAEAPESIRALAPIIPWRPGASILLLSADGTVWRGQPTQGVAPWLAQVVAGAAFNLQRVVDFNNLGIAEGVTLVAGRRSKSSRWQVGAVAGNPPGIAKSAGLVLSQIDVASEVVMELLYPAVPVMFTNPSSEALMAKVRSGLGKNLTVGPRWSAGSQAVPPAASGLGDLANRVDIVPGPVQRNPFDDFLYWISERSEGAGMSLAAVTLAWLYDVYGQEPPDFAETIRSLRTLGYVRADSGRGRLVAAPTSAALIPMGEGLSLLSGARGERFGDELREPSDDHSPEVLDALQDLIVYEAVQTKHGVPIAPTTTYLLLGAEEPGVQATALNVNFVPHQADALLSGVVPILDYVEDSHRTFSLVHSIRYDEFLPSDIAPGGRWRSVRVLPHTDAFLRARTSSGDHYLWWNHSAGRLSECGWIAGLWAFHARFTGRLLIDRVHVTSQLLVSDWAPLPRAVERAIVARSGLLPRVARAEGKLWRVYDNVPGPVVVKVRELLGQTVEMRRPSELEYL